MMDKQIWGIMALETGERGHGARAAAQLHAALMDAWEPFAVSDGQIWLRKKQPVETYATGVDTRILVEP